MRYLCLSLFLISLALGQTNTPVVPVVPEVEVLPPEGPTSDEALAERERLDLIASLSFSNRIEKMQALLVSLNGVSNQLSEARREHAESADEPTRKRLDNRITSLLIKESDLQEDFEELAIGAAVDRSLFSNAEKPPFDLRSELEKLAEPIVDEMKRVTAESQRESALADELEHQQKRRMAAEQAVLNLKRMLETPSPVDSELQDLLRDWKDRYDTAKSQEEQAELQLDEIEAAKKPLLESSRAYLTDFMKNRGLHLLLGILAFCIVFFGLRGLYAIYRKARPLKHYRSFASRLLSLLFHLFTTLAAVGALLLAFQITNDWFLLTLSIIFLIGVGWVSIKTLPTMFEQVKLMLNFGAVREHELLMWNGIPWQVDDLGLMAILVNPNLSGGEQILPIRDLVGLVSRRPGTKEPWFPSQEGDWVRLQDGLMGEIICQTPTSVVLQRFGGSAVTFTVTEYIERSPENLSKGFRIEQIFGLDYRHRAEATGTIPARMQADLQRRLTEEFGEAAFENILVAFASASSSSLDYRIEAWCSGEAAPHFERIERAIPRILVDACNENDWLIPFTQITIHGSRD